MRLDVFAGEEGQSVEASDASASQCGSINQMNQICESSVAEQSVEVLRRADGPSEIVPENEFVESSSPFASPVKRSHSQSVLQLDFSATVFPTTSSEKPSVVPESLSCGEDPVCDRFEEASLPALSEKPSIEPELLPCGKVPVGETFEDTSASAVQVSTAVEADASCCKISEKTVSRSSEWLDTSELNMFSDEEVDRKNTSVRKHPFQF